jgi:hypothetical protein
MHNDNHKQNGAVGARPRLVPPAESYATLFRWPHNTLPDSDLLHERAGSAPPSAPSYWGFGDAVALGACRQ